MEKQLLERLMLMLIKSLQQSMVLEIFQRVLLFKDGELVSRQVGVAPKKTYEDAINAAL